MAMKLRRVWSKFCAGAAETERRLAVKRQNRLWPL